MSAETKYGNLINENFRWSCANGVDLIRHSLRRWDERTPPDSDSPEIAWERGAVIPETFYEVLADKEGARPDEARTYYENQGVECAYQAVLIARDGVIKTVYSMDMFTGPERCYLSALRPFVDGVGDGE